MELQYPQLSYVPKKKKKKREDQERVGVKKQNDNYMLKN